MSRQSPRCILEQEGLKVLPSHDGSNFASARDCYPQNEEPLRLKYEPSMVQFGDVRSSDPGGASMMNLVE